MIQFRSLLFVAIGTVSSISPSFAESPQQASLGITTAKPATGPSVELTGKFMVPYSVTIPGTDVAFEMIPVPGGKVLMGSPEGEAGRTEDEGPQIEVEVQPMWVQKTELTWGEYKLFMSLYPIFKKSQREGIRNAPFLIGG